MYPMIKSSPGEALVYAYVEVRGFTPHTKVLVVTMDASGAVSGLELRTSGSP
jgi:hypothetical protein